ncbi:hypothetical protein OAL71_00410 [Phycisphaerales bacterium]|nr:hypothetical protein [Phycisphaerales bacterium]RPG19779.1 MAG: hypothetical protein CBB69_004400 [Phycisphaera sp. TMED9]
MTDALASSNVNRAAAILFAGVLLLPVASAVASLEDEGREQVLDRAMVDIAPEHHGKLDPILFFKRLADRYRAIDGYVEETEVEQVTNDPATEDPPIRTRTRVRAEVSDSRLHVERPGVLDDFARALSPPAAGAAERDLWLLPHLRLRFSSNPLEQFRKSEGAGFRAAEADRVMVDDREMVRVELRSGGEGESGSSDATFSLFVDPERMLVERVEGEEWLPGGIRQQTTLRIESMQLRDDRYVAEPLPESSPEAIEPPATVLPMRLGPAAVPFLEEDGRSVPPNRTPEEDQVEPSTPEQVPPSLPGVPQTTGLRG